MIDAHRDRALGVGVAERDIELAGAARQQRGFGGRRSPRGKTAFRGRHHTQLLTIERDGERRDHLAEIRPLPLRQPVELQFVAGDLCHVIRLHRADIFAVPGRLADDAYQRDADAGMRERRAPRRARQTAGAAHRNAQRQAEQSGALDKVA